MKFDKERAKDDFNVEIVTKGVKNTSYNAFDWLAEEIDISGTFPCDQKKPCKNHNIQRINLYLKHI